MLVDGVDVRDREREHALGAGRAGPQKAFLFAGTVASNLRFGDADATRRGALARAHDAQARDFVGGHARRPRLADHPGRVERLGRPAAASRHRPGASSEGPDIYVFDDSFSALDVATDARLRAALAEKLRTPR